MRFLSLLAASGAALMLAAPAHAITVDGVIDADYGAAKSVVIYDPAAPTSNFGSPTPFSNAIGYTVYLNDSNGFVYGLLQTSGPGSSVGSFANLYFGTSTSSTIGFEITNQKVFTPSTGASASVPINYVATADTIEFALPESYFTSPPAGLSPTGLNPGSTLFLRISQSFGYSAAGGTDYGPNRLGTVQLSGGPVAAPGPIAGAGIIPLLGLAGGWLARRRRKTLAA